MGNMWLYNGKPFPKIPVVAGYDCAAILYDSVKEDGTVSEAELILSAMPLYRGYANNGITLCLKASASGSAIKYSINLDNGDTDWTKGTEREYSENGQVTTAHAAMVRWASYDVLKSDGTLYLAASDPVPVSPVQINPALLVQSFFTGQALRRMRGVQPEKKLVGYLYGGVGPLPEIPKVDGLDYSWVVDGTAMQMGYIAITASIAPTFDGGVVGAFGCKYVIYTTDGTIWNIEEEGDKTDPDEGVGMSIALAPTIWTSHDILTTDGSTYLAASEPVPVYE